MSKKTNLEVVLLHEKDDTLYKVSATMTSINEDAGTCTLEFRNGRIVKGVSTKKVCITEGAIDSLKKLGKRFVNWVVKNVKGFFVLTDKSGKALEGTQNNPINLAVLSQKGQMPNGINFYPSETLVEAASDNGIDISSDDEGLVSADDAENRRVEEYWRNVQTRYATSEDTLEEAVAYVNARHPLFEASQFTIGAIEDEAGMTDKYGDAVNSTELKAMIRENILAQLKVVEKRTYAGDDFDSKEIADDGGDYSDIDDALFGDNEYGKAAAETTAKRQKHDVESETRDVPPLCVWGAPGIGKTQIIKQVLADLRRDMRYSINLSIETVNCSALTKDDVQLAVYNRDDVETEGGDKVSLDRINPVPQSCFPMYQKKGKAHNELMEQVFASCAHLNGELKPEYIDGRIMDGGVLFFDEIARLEPAVQHTFMSLVDGKLGNLVMAKSWAVICAANRQEDDDTQYADKMLDNNPFVNRFHHCLYVPSREEWLTWAKSDKNGRPNIAPEITNFIEYIGDSVWYNAVMFGSEPDRIKAYLAAQGDGRDPEQIRATYEEFENMTQSEHSPLSGSAVIYNPREWERISNEYYRNLEELFANVGVSFDKLFAVSKGKYDYAGIAPAVMSRMLQKVSAQDWEYWYRSKFPELCVDSKGIAKKLDSFDLVARITAVQSLLVKIVGRFTGSKESLPVQKMKDFYSWKAMFLDPEVCKAIYGTGLMPKAYQAQDELSSDNNGFAWKSDTQTRDEVIKFILNAYPGTISAAATDARDYLTMAIEMTKDIHVAIEQIENAKKGAKTEKEIVKALVSIMKLTSKDAMNPKDLQEFFTIHTTGDYGDYQLDDVADMHPVTQAILGKMIKNCAFFRNMINYVKFIGHTCLSEKNISLAEKYSNSEKFLQLVRSGMSLPQDVQGQIKKLSGILQDASDDDSAYKPVREVKYIDVFAVCRMFLRNLADISTIKTGAMSK